MPNGSDNPIQDSPDGQSQRLSYKFQRLRERLREAIRSGELAGKLPGERQLARRFRVNAKTLSKALTDLAAEGLLDRSIGRGTYVRGSGSVPSSTEGRWLLLVDDVATPHWLLGSLKTINSDVHPMPAALKLRPSDLANVRGVIDVASETSDECIRDLLVRNVPTVLVNKQPRGYSTHTIAVDRHLGCANLAREMVLLGHRRFFVVEAHGLAATVYDIVRQIVARYDASASVDHGYASDASAAVAQGVTAVICACTLAATEVMKQLAGRNIVVPGQVSIGCAGAAESTVPCSGYYVMISEFAKAIGTVLRDHSSSRPTALWLAGGFREQGTIVPPSMAPSLAEQPGAAIAAPLHAIDRPS